MGFGFSKITPNFKYTNTLSARYYKDGSEILIGKEEENHLSKLPRKLTPRECARLQGFPENFKIPVSDTQSYRQFGNSITINVVESIFDNLI